jgi:hypothetical protein
MLRNSAAVSAAVIVSAIFASVAASANAAPPQITNIAPLGLQRGVAAELTISGGNLTANPRLIAPFHFHLEPAPPPAKSDAGNWKSKLTIAADVAVGVYPIRVQTDDGISNPFLLAVGQLRQVSEKEDNTTFETAQVLSDLPVVIEGQVAGNDVDYFRFHGKKGEAIVVDAQCARIGSGIDPTIRLVAAGPSRTYVASADDSPGLLTDARLTATLPADGDYVVEISDSRYQGASRPVYRLLVGAVPMADEIYPLGGRIGETVGLELRGGTVGSMHVAAATLNPAAGSELVAPRISAATLGLNAPSPEANRLEVESLSPLLASPYPEIREPLDPAASPTRAVAPVVLNGRIDPPGDEDSFILAVTPGQRLRVRVQAYEHGSALDAVLRVHGNAGALIANGDDTTVNLPPKNNLPQSLALPDPSLEFTIPGDTKEITLVMRDLQGRGGIGFPYRIKVEPLFPDFHLLANDTQVSVPRGGTATVSVTIERKGFTGPITITVADPPPGLSVRAGTIPAGQTAGVLTLSAAPDAAFPPAPIKLIGQAQGSSGPIERIATRAVVYAQQPPLATCSITELGLVAAPALPLPVTLETPATPIEVAQGFGMAIPVKVIRSKDANGALAITPLPLTPGIVVPAATIAEKALEGNVVASAAANAPLGTVTVGLQAKGKIAGADHTIALPAVTLAIVTPATVELKAANLEIKAGATATLTGKVVRRGGYNSPGTIKLNGLPAGLKADPVALAAGASEFTIKITADAKAAAASANGQVVLTYQVDKKDVSAPPAALAVKVTAGK